MIKRKRVIMGRRKKNGDQAVVAATFKAGWKDRFKVFFTGRVSVNIPVKLLMDAMRSKGTTIESKGRMVKR